MAIELTELFTSTEDLDVKLTSQEMALLQGGLSDGDSADAGCKAGEKCKSGAGCSLGAKCKTGQGQVANDGGIDVW